MHQKKAAKSQVVSRNDDPDWREWVMTFEEKLMINGEEKRAEGKLYYRKKNGNSSPSKYGYLDGVSLPKTVNDRLEEQ